MPTPTLYPSPETGRRISAEEETALLNAFVIDARAYASALQTGDAGSVATLLAGRCPAGAAPGIIMRRRAELLAAAGAPIERLAVIGPLVGHFDAPGGEAHAFVGFQFEGQRVLTGTPDGWLYERGRWRSAEC
jgi:hypothetical protein